MRVAAAIVTAAALSLTACGGGSSATTTTSTTAAVPTTTSTSMTLAAATDTLVSFPTAASAERWVNIDDSVMGGISASQSSWVDTDGGALLFTGTLSTERNGGFASTLGPADASIGPRAAGARALAVDAIGDGRTYLLQLRAGPRGGDRWIARFTPPIAQDRTGAARSVIAIDAFESVNGFLRPTTPSAPLDPATISQIGVYVLDGQVGEFRLVLERIVAVR